MHVTVTVFCLGTVTATNMSRPEKVREADRKRE